MQRVGVSQSLTTSVHLRHALIQGDCPHTPGKDRDDLELDLDAVHVPFPIYFYCCALPGGVQLRDAVVVGLFALPGSYVTQVRLDRARIHRGVWLGWDSDQSSPGLTVTNRISVLGARIEGDLRFNRSELRGDVHIEGA